MEIPSYLTATAKSKGVGQVNALEYGSTPSAGEALRSRCRKRRISAANRTVIVGDQPKTIGFIAFGQEKRLPKGELVTRRRATPRLLTWTPSRLGNSAVLRAMSMAPVKAPRSSHVPTGHLLIRTPGRPHRPSSDMPGCLCAPAQCRALSLPRTFYKAPANGNQ